jgi:hypothetical protein
VLIEPLQCAQIFSETTRDIAMACFAPHEIEGAHAC